MAPTGSGGTARVGVSTASYGASASSAPAANRRMAPSASPNSGPLTARPRSVSQRVSGRSRCSCSGGTVDSAVSTDQQVSNTGTASRRQRDRDVDELVAERRRAAAEASS